MRSVWQILYIQLANIGQEEDGFSAIEHGEVPIFDPIPGRVAFTIVSDVGLSGEQPYNSEELIRRIKKRAARTYDDAYRVVLMAKLHEGTPHNIAAMERYLVRLLWES